MRRLLLAGLLLPGAAAGASLPRTGDYLDTAYIQALEHTQSPLRAAQATARTRMPQMLTIQPQGSARRVALSWNWHTGTLLAVLQRNGTLRRELAWGAGPDIALRLQSNAICLTAPSTPEHCYRYVGNATAFITHATLVGQYLDRQGKSFTFADNATAHFPGYDFSYSLVLDQVADPYDFFAIGTEGRFMAFRRTADSITLYQVGPPHGAALGTPDFAHPLAILHAASLGKSLHAEG